MKPWNRKKSININKLHFFCLFFFALMPLAKAGILTPVSATTELDGVKIVSKGSLQLGNNSYTMDIAGSGIRKKQVAIFKASVYVAQFFVSDISKFKRGSAAEANDSIPSMAAVAITITFLRDVEAKKLFSAFEEGFKANGIAIDSVEMKDFLEKVKTSGEAKKGSAWVIAGEKRDGVEQIYLENSEKRLDIVKGPTGFIHKVFALWFGKPTDSGLEDLQKQILKGTSL